MEHRAAEIYAARPHFGGETEGRSMKVSEITPDQVIEYARMDTESMDISPEMLLQSAKAYIRGQTGLGDEEMDRYEDLSIAVLALCSDWYDNRQMTVEKSNANRVVQSILDLHSRNLLAR